MTDILRIAGGVFTSDPEMGKKTDEKSDSSRSFARIDRLKPAPPRMVLGAIAVGILVAGLSGCSRENVKAAPNDAVAPTVETVPDRNVVTVANPERFSVSEAAARHESDQILANGVVAADVSRSYAVNALSSGRVVDVKARLGDDVQKGQLLLTMTSPDMSQAFADYQKFQADASAGEDATGPRAASLFAWSARHRRTWKWPQDTYNKANIDTQDRRGAHSAFWEEIRSISRR